MVIPSGTSLHTESGVQVRPTRTHAHDGASGASRRLRALAALSGSLTDALSPGEAADLVERKALSALDATSAVVVTLGPFPPKERATAGAHGPGANATLHVVHAMGVAREIAAALEELPLDAAVPFAEVARTGEPVFLPGAAEMRRYADWSQGMIAAGLRSAAIVPVWANGELRGVLGLAWPDARAFDEDERAFVLTLGVMCAQSIMRAHLRETERLARLDADAARRNAEVANKSKADFVATISHELRTPMNAVIGYTALLADEIYGPLTAAQRDNIGRVQTSGKHVVSLIEDLLTFARIDAGHETVEIEPVLLNEIVEQSVTIVRPLAETKGLAMRAELPSEPVTLYTDARKLRQILVNLLANAVKYSSVGDVSLVVRVADAEAEIRFRFEVTDQGIGMTKAEQERAFDPFWRASAKTANTDGTGLGLSVARKLAQLLGGDLFIAKSEPGKGSTFVMTLPPNGGEPGAVGEGVAVARDRKAVT